MPSRNRHLNKGEDKTDINISPMIDMVFILLIFFIVTTVFVDEAGIDVDKPQPAPPDQQEEKDTEPVIIRVTEQGQLTYKGDPISLGRLEDIVKEALSRDEDLPVILQVQRGAIASPMIMAMDHAKVAGATKISVTAVD